MQYVIRVLESDLYVDGSEGTFPIFTRSRTSAASFSEAREAAQFAEKVRQQIGTQVAPLLVLERLDP